MKLLRSTDTSCFHPATLLYCLINGGEERETLASDFVAKANDAYAGTAYNGLLENLAARQNAQLAAFSPEWESRIERFTVNWRMVAGLSYGRLWGFSLQLHPLYGVPYLPASGIKGALRNWAIEEGRAETLVWLDQAFGLQENRATLVLLDSFPLASPKLLQEDVLNKHHDEYFEADDPTGHPPAGYNNPEPVKFVTLHRGVQFRIGFAVRKEGQLNTAEFSRLLHSCLADAGMGAKSRKGYGRLSPAERPGVR